MKRLCAIFLLLSLLLCACAQTEAGVPPTPPTEPGGPAPLSQGADAGNSSARPARSPQEAADFLCGSWHSYNPSAHADTFWLDLLADGTYTASADTGAGLLGWSEDEATEFPVYTYCGTWTVEEWDGEETPYLLCLSLSQTDDPAFAGADSLGDYLFRTLSLCDGELLVEFVQANNGDGIYTRHFMWIDPWAMERADERPLTQTAHKNATFCAQIWKMDYEPVYTIFADDVVLAEDGSIVNEVRESVRYEVLSGAEETCELSGGPDGLFALGETTYMLTTDENGIVVSARYIPHGPAPSEEDALAILSCTSDARDLLAMGMRTMYEGWGQIFDGMYCAYITLGTDHDEQFVREVRYAVATDGFAYRYDALTDEWNWVE